MNICFVTAGHNSPTRGGVDRVVDVLAKELRHRGHMVVMMSLLPPKNGEEIKDYQIVLPENGWADTEKNRQFLIDLIRSNNIDILINHADRMDILQLLAFSAKESDSKLITCIHTDPEAAKKGVVDSYAVERQKKSFSMYFLSLPIIWARGIYRYYNRKRYAEFKWRKIIEMSDRVVVLSQIYIDKIASKVGLSVKEKIVAIGNPLSFPTGQFDDCQKERLVIYVGRMNLPVKRVDRMLRIWKMADAPAGWRLVLLGEGDDLDWFKNYAESLRLQNVSFVGRVNPEEYYKKAAVCCLTSSHEGFGMTLTESRQFGAVPIAFNCSGAISEILLDGRAGIIVPPFKEKKFAHELHRLMADEEYRAGMASREITDEVEAKFNIKTIADRWEEIICQCKQKEFDSIC